MCGAIDAGNPAITEDVILNKYNTAAGDSKALLDMNELELKYGCNPNQKPARIFMRDGCDLPVTVLNGKPGYINFLDALNSLPAGAGAERSHWACPPPPSFKHVSPAGAAMGLPLDDALSNRCIILVQRARAFPLACAYARARGADRHVPALGTGSPCLMCATLPPPS